MDALIDRYNHIYKKYGCQWIQESDTFDIPEDQKKALLKFRRSEQLFVYKGKEDINHEIKPSTYDQLYDMIKAIRTSTEYDSYITLLNQFLETIGLTTGRVVESGTMNLTQRRNNYLIVRLKNAEDETIHLKKGDKLYHSSKIAGISQLNPSFKAGDKNDRYDMMVEALYPTERVYFYANGMGNRLGGSGILFNNEYVYEYTVPEEMDVKIDQELASLKSLNLNEPIPVFIETKTPLPVREVEKNAKVLKA